MTADKVRQLAEQAGQQKLGMWLSAWLYTQAPRPLPEAIEIADETPAHDWRRYLLPGDAKAWAGMPDEVRRIVADHAHNRAMSRTTSLSWADTEDEYMERYFAGDRSKLCVRSFATSWNLAMSGREPGR